jgi:hypothetical protein
MSADRLPLASFDALADTRAQLDVAIAQALVRVARVAGSEHAEDEARRLDEALMAALAAVRAIARPS